MKQYLHILSNKNFALLWSGLTVSQIGDSLSWVALIWFIYELTDSPVAVGFFLFFYTAPTIIGGLIAGILLDRFNRRKVMIVDNVIRALSIGTLPILHHLGLLQMWHMYAVALVFGSLMMISLAGGPAIVPSLLRKEELNTANALESISWTLGDIIGRVAAGVLIGIIGALNVLLLDVVTYLVFVVCLWKMVVPDVESAAPTSDVSGPDRQSLWEGFRFIFLNKLIFAITLVFLFVNFGAGPLGVILPLYADVVLQAGAQGFGLLTAGMSMGQLASSILAGGIPWRFPLGRSIAVALVLTGGVFGLLVLPLNLAVATGALFVFGFCLAPINIWAQTIRMRVIPEALRGRVFSILRTIIRSSIPLSTSIFGFILPLIGIQNTILLAGSLIAIPGLLALIARAFEEPNAKTHEKSLQT